MTPRSNKLMIIKHKNVSSFPSNVFRPISKRGDKFFSKHFIYLQKVEIFEASVHDIAQLFFVLIKVH